MDKAQKGQGTFETGVVREEMLEYIRTYAVSVWKSRMRGDKRNPKAMELYRYLETFCKRPAALANKQASRFRNRRKESYKNGDPGEPEEELYSTDTADENRRMRWSLSRTTVWQHYTGRRNRELGKARRTVRLVV